MQVLTNAFSGGDLLEFIYLLPLPLTLMLGLQPIFDLRPIHTCSISFN